MTVIVNDIGVYIRLANEMTTLANDEVHYEGSISILYVQDDDPNQNMKHLEELNSNCW